MPCWGFPACRSRLTIFPSNFCLQFFIFHFANFTKCCSHPALLPSWWAGKELEKHLRRKWLVHVSTSRKPTLLLENLRFHSPIQDSGLDLLKEAEEGDPSVETYPFIPSLETRSHKLSLPLCHCPRCPWSGADARQSDQQQRPKSFRTRGEAPPWRCLNGWCIKRSSVMTWKSSWRSSWQIFFQTPSLDLLQEQTLKSLTPTRQCLAFPLWSRLL